MALPVSRDAFISFLLNAKRQTYATQGDEATVTPLLPGSRQLEYQDGALLYRDIYFGGAYFVGQETVYYNASPAWAMCYAGGLVTSEGTSIDMRQVYEFLRAALRQIEAERPYRGPKLLQDGAYRYQDESEGDVEQFWGIETITHNGTLVYRLHYRGYAET